MHEQLRHRLLGWWSRVVSHWPGVILLVAIALAVAAVAVTAWQLEFQANRNDLISTNLDWNQRFIRWQSLFPSGSDVIVIVDTHDATGEPGKAAAERARAAVRDLAARLSASDATTEVTWGYDVSQIHPRAIRLSPLPEFEQQLARIAASEPMLRSPTPQALIRTGMATAQTGAAAEAEADDLADARAGLASFAAMVQGFTRRLETPADEPVELFAQTATMNGGESWEYLSTPNRRLLILRVGLRDEPGALSPYGRAIGEVRRNLDAARQRHRDVVFGMTGVPVIEADETAAATADSTRASIVATVLITILLISAFHSLRVPLMLMFSLMVGIAWSFGFLTLAIGHLQVISVIFTVILLGLGVAFGIHLVSGFELRRHRYPDTERGFRRAMRDTLESVGPGIVTGAVTTAAAFGTTLLTDFRGVAEMGAIAAAGILLCLVAMIVVFPALLRRFKRGHKHFIRLEDRTFHVFNEKWVMPFTRRPRLTLAVAGVVTALSLLAITQLRFDYNLVELMPRNLESVQWQRRIADQGEQSIWSAVSVTESIDDARVLARQYRSMSQVGGVGGIGLLFPSDETLKLEMIRDLRAQLAGAARQALAGAPPPDRDEPHLVQQMRSVQLALPFMQTQMPAALHPPLRELSGTINLFIAAAEALPAEQRERRLAALQLDYERDRQQTAALVLAALDDGPMQIDDLPAELIGTYMAKADGRRWLALEVYPHLPDDVQDPLNPRVLGPFVRQVQAVDGEATGSMVQLFLSGELIWQAYVRAGGLALIAVLVLVWIDFRSLADAVLTLVPVAVGFAVTFAIMWLVGLQINPANIMVLPLMFGIGVDAGVHMLHRYRQSPTLRPLGLTGGTGKGITLTSFTTMIGFGSLMLAQHRGIAGVGFVLCVGIGMTLLACWLIVPAWLELRARSGQKKSATDGHG